MITSPHRKTGSGIYIQYCFYPFYLSPAYIIPLLGLIVFTIPQLFGYSRIDSPVVDHIPDFIDISGYRKRNSIVYVFCIQHKIITFLGFQVKIRNRHHIRPETGSIRCPEIQVAPLITQDNIGSSIVFKKFVIDIPQPDHSLKILPQPDFILQEKSHRIHIFPIQIIGSTHQSLFHILHTHRKFLCLSEFKNTF